MQVCEIAAVLTSLMSKWKQHRLTTHAGLWRKARK